MEDAGYCTFILRCQEERIDPFVSFDHVNAGSGEGSFLSDVSFEIGAGERVALIGPGASGKTLLLRLILGLSLPESGTISVFGEEPGSASALQHIGAVLDTTDFPTDLKVKEIIDLANAHFSQAGTPSDLIERLGLDDKLNRRVGSLTGAQQRVLSIMLAMLGQPAGLVMDSPTAGMEAGWRRQFWNLLMEYTASGHSAIVSTDVMRDVELYATRILLLHDGQIIADGTAGEIRDRYGGPVGITSPLADAGIDGPGALRTPQQAALAVERVHAQGLEQVILQLTGEDMP
jgi:ABC-type multidrug transport system ATPase subunit